MNLVNLVNLELSKNDDNNIKVYTYICEEKGIRSSSTPWRSLNHPSGWFYLSDAAATLLQRYTLWQSEIATEKSPFFLSEFPMGHVKSSMRSDSLVGGLVAINFIFPFILGMSSSQLTNFQRGGPTTNQFSIAMFDGWYPKSTHRCVSLGHQVKVSPVSLDCQW